MDFLLQNYFLNYIKSSHQNPKQTIYILFFLNGALKSFPSRIGCDIAHNLVLALKNEEISIELATHIYSTIEVIYSKFYIIICLLESSCSKTFEQ